MSRPISTGNLRRYLAGCECGRAFELETATQPIPDHEHNHRARSEQLQTSGIVRYTCTGCTWTVETHTNRQDPEGTAAKVAEAFLKHHAAND